MSSNYFKNLIKAGIKAATAVGALAAAALILKSDNSDNKDQAKPQPEKPTEPQAPNNSASQTAQAPDKAAPPESENTSLAFPDEFYPKPEEIYVPDHRKAGTGDVPYIDLTEKEAIAQGWSFHKKSKAVRITNYHGRARDVVIPSRIGGKRVNEIGTFVFRKRMIDRVHIPGGIVKIGENAFIFCKMREVIFGSRENGLRVIPKDAFYSCEELKRVILPNTLLEIGKSAFAFCGSLEYIALPESLIKVREEAFYCSGLCGFSTWHSIRLYDGSIFNDTPLQKNYKIIAARNTENELIILSVANEAKIKLPKKRVEFTHNSVCCKCSLDLSECTELAFNNDHDEPDYNLFPTEIIVRHGQEGYFFGKKATVSYTDGTPYPKLLQPVEQNGDQLTVRYTGRPYYNRLPDWYVKFGVKSLKIVTDNMFLTIRSSAIWDPKLERLEFDYYFGAEGKIFSAYNCVSLREFRWKGKYNKGQYVQYIPPEELISEHLHYELLTAFRDVETPDAGIGSFFDSSVFEEVFKRRYFKPLAGYNLKAAESQIHERHLIPVAIDVLRSTPYQFPNGTKMYSDYLRRHLTYARKFCEKIRPRYPEYAEFLKDFK